MLLEEDDLVRLLREVGALIMALHWHVGVSVRRNEGLRVVGSCRSGLAAQLVSASLQKARRDDVDVHQVIWPRIP